MFNFIKKYKIKLIILLLLILLLVGLLVIKSERYMLWKTPNREELLEQNQLEEYYDRCLNAGIEKNQDKDYKGAVIEYKKLLKISPGSEAGLNNLADVYINLEEYENAEECFQKALDIRFEPFIFQKLLKLYYSKMRNFTKAKNSFEYVYAIKKDDYNVVIIGANFYREIKDYKSAYKYYQIAYEMNPEDQAVKEEMEWIKGKISEQ